MGLPINIQATQLQRYLTLLKATAVGILAGLCTLLLIAYTSLRQEKVQIMLTSCEDQTRMIGKRLKAVFQVQSLLTMVLLVIECFSAVCIPFILHQSFSLTSSTILAICIYCIFGLLAPRLFCRNNQLIQIAYSSSWIVLILKQINKYINLNRCVSSCLKKKKKDTIISRQNIAEVLNLHQNVLYGYKPQQIEILQNIMKVKRSAVESLMIKIDHVFMIDIQSVVNEAFVKKISRYYFTKALVYQNSRNNVIGYMQFKKILLFNIRKQETVKSRMHDVVQKNIVILRAGDTLMDGIQQMQDKQINFALIYDDETEDYIGIIKLKDIFKKLVFKWYDYNTLKPDLSFRSKSGGTYLGKDDLIIKEITEGYEQA